MQYLRTATSQWATGECQPPPPFYLCLCHSTLTSTGFDHGNLTDLLSSCTYNLWEPCTASIHNLHAAYLLKA